MIKITFLGDIMCDNNMAASFEKYNSGESGSYDFTSVFDGLKGMLGQSDLVVANLETPLTDSKAGLTNKQYLFNTPYEFAIGLKKAGIGFVATANNHCLDNGIIGLEETIKCLDYIGIGHCGTQVLGSKNYSIIHIRNMKIGILSYTYGTNAFVNHCYLPFKYRKSVNLLQEQEEKARILWKKIFRGKLLGLYTKLEKIVYPGNDGKQIYERQTLQMYRRFQMMKTIWAVKREKPDHLFALLHIGGQYNARPSDYTKKTSRWFLNNGCSAVIDNHEHVVHNAEYINGKLVSYALGNCLGSAGVTKPPYDTMSEYSVALHLYLDEKQRGEDSGICKVAFSVLKTIQSSDGKLEVWPAVCLKEYEGYEEFYDELEILSIADAFSGKKNKQVQQEFMLIE